MRHKSPRSSKESYKSSVVEDKLPMQFSACSERFLDAQTTRAKNMYQCRAKLHFFFCGFFATSKSDDFVFVVESSVSYVSRGVV